MRRWGRRVVRCLRIRPPATLSACSVYRPRQPTLRKHSRPSMGTRSLPEFFAPLKGLTRAVRAGLRGWRSSPCGGEGGDPSRCRVRRTASPSPLLCALHASAPLRQPAAGAYSADGTTPINTEPQRPRDDHRIWPTHSPLLGAPLWSSVSSVVARRRRQRSRRPRRAPRGPLTSRSPSPCGPCGSCRSRCRRRPPGRPGRPGR